VSFARGIYTGVMRLAAPALLVHLARRGRRQGAGADDWRSRLGWVAVDDRHPVWIHAASAGELQAVAPLVAALAAQAPVHLSVFTGSGRVRARHLLEALPVSLSPLDLPGAWRRFLTRIEPRLALIAETELWPNLLAEARRRALAVVLVNARMSPRTCRRLARFPGATRELMRALSLVLAQGPEDLERFHFLGLPQARGQVAGNLKETWIIPRADREQGRRWRAGALAGRRVWVAGSVREGEEEALAEAIGRLRQRVEAAVTIVVPRHPERAAAFAAGLERAGIPVLPETALAGAPVAPGAVILIARIGVLLGLYAAADVAFVGGTLAPLGGHNVLEPALSGLPVLVGPSTENVRAAVSRLRAAGALCEVSSGGELGEAVAALLADGGRLKAMGEAARRAGSNPVPLTRTLAAIEPYL